MDKKNKPKEKPKKPNSKPKEKPKPKENPKTPKSKPKEKKKQTKGRITIIRDHGGEDNTIDHYYERKINNIVKKIKEQNEFGDDKIRFGWNTII
jgi:hypothetical protein